MTLLRLAVAAAAPLSPDEAYYWVWSRTLAAGYFDHPPMVALFIRAGTALAGDGALGVRLLAPVSAALGTWLLARAAEDVWPGMQAGPRAAVLMNATLLMGAGSVTMTPDTPLLLFWTACLAAVARLLATGNGRWWLAAGMAAGLALASKYSAALLAPALLLWLLMTPSVRAWATRPWPYLGAALALLIFAPVLAWNEAHGWAGILKQGGRLGDASGGWSLGYLAELAGGQIGLATPGLALLFAVGIAACAAASMRRVAGATLLACMTLLPMAVFVQHALGDRVQANWPAIVYPGAAIAAAGPTGRLTGRWRRWASPSVALGAVVTGAVYIQAVLAPLPLPATMDPTLSRLGGWAAFARAVAQAATEERAAYVAVDNYGLASMLAWQQPALRIVAVEPRWAFFGLPSGGAALAAGPGLLLRPARRTDRPDPRDWATVEAGPTLVRSRHGVTAEAYGLYRVTAHPGGTASALLPHQPGADHAPADP